MSGDELFDAAKKGNFDLVKECIVNNADINAPNKFMSWTPLHVAVGFARESAVDIIKYLIAAKANLEAPDSNGRTALHLAARSGKIDSLRYLISVGADLESRTIKNGNTALLLACGGGSFETTKLLLESGANPEVQDNDGKNALARAEIKGYDKIAALLKGEEYEEEENPQMMQLNAMLGSLTQLASMKKGAENDVRALGIDPKELVRRAQQNQTPPSRRMQPSLQPIQPKPMARQTNGVHQQLEELRFDHEALKKVVMAQDRELSALKQSVFLLASKK